MKNLKKTLMVLCTLFIAGVCFAIPKTAEAADAKTYTLHWDGSKWYYQTSVDSNWIGVEMIDSGFNAGDAIVVDGQGQSGLKTCEITVTKGTGDVCATGGATLICNVSGGKVNQAFATGSGTTIINGDVNNALPSAQGILQINGNVSYLNVNYDFGTPKFGITGTVGKAFAKINSQTPDTFYSIVAGKMNPDSNGIVWLNAGEFSTKDPGNSGNSSQGNGNNLDKVPKTGSFALESSLAIIALAIIMGAGSIVLLTKKKEY